MVRRVLSDSIWIQIKKTMKTLGCHSCPNDRKIMEAILWKLRTGAPWRDLPEEFCPWKTAYNRFNRWSSKGLWEGFFLSYERKLIQRGYSPMEVMSGLISMQVELGVEKSVPLDALEEGQPLKFILPPMRMDIRSILKSLGVKYTTAKLLTN